MKHFLAKTGIISAFLIYYGQAIHAMENKEKKDTHFQNRLLIQREKQEELAQFHKNLLHEINEFQKTKVPEHMKKIFELLATKKRIGLRPYHKLYDYELTLFKEDNRKLHYAAEIIEELRKKNEKMEEFKKIEETFSALFDTIEKEQNNFSKECSKKAKGIACEYRPNQN